MNGPLFIISDLHMGDRGPRDNFEVGHRERDLRELLAYVRQQQGELWILGDLFELWQTNLSRVIVERLPVLDLLADLGAVYILGNHDVDLKRFIGTGLLGHRFFNTMTGPTDRVIGGRRVRFMHGHETDRFNSSENPNSGRMLAILAGMVEDWNGSPLFPSGKSVEATLEKAGERLLKGATTAAAILARLVRRGATPDLQQGTTPTQSANRRDEHLMQMHREWKRGAFDAVVVGHTHRPGQVGDWYFNAGSWVKEKNDFLVIDPEAAVTYCQWAQGAPQRMPMPVPVFGKIDPGALR